MPHSQSRMRPSGNWTPKSISGLALWLDGSDANILYTTDAGAVTEVSAPTDISGCVLWLDGADSSAASMTLNGSLVEAWKDKSGSNNNATASGTARPTLTSGGLNGKSVVTFDGTANAMQIAANAAFNSNDLTYFVVFKQAAAANKGVYTKLNANAGTNGFGLVVRSDPQIWLLQKNAGASQVLTSTANPTTQARIYTVTSSSTAAGYLDGLSSATAASTADHSLVQRVMVGSRDSSEYLNGYVAEVIHYNRVLTRSELAQVEAWLAAKWGITGVHRPVSQELTAVSSPLELQGCAVWLDGSDSTTLYTTDAGAVTAVSAPTEISGCVGWWDSADLSSMRQNSDGTGTVAAGDPVGWWKDKSATGANVTGSGSARPTLSATGFNSKQALVFNGSSTNLSNPSYTATNGLSGMTVIAVCGNTSGVANLSRVYPAGFQGLWMNGGRRFYVDDSSNVNFSSSGVGGSNALAQGLYAFRFASSSIDNYETGSLIAATVNGTIPSTTGANAAAAIHIGSNIGANAFWNGPIAEYIIFNRALTRAELARVEAYLAAKWGIGGVHANATATNDPVGYWADKSGNGRHARQSTAANRPKTNTAGMNGTRSVQFSGGNNELLSLGDLSAAFPSAGEVIVAFEPLSDSSYGLYETSANSSYFRNTNGLSYFGAFSQSRQNGVSATTPTTGRHVASIRCNSGGQQVVRVDGVQIFTGTPQGSGYLAGTSHVIGNNNNGAADTGLTGYVAEVICYNTILSDTDRAKVEKYLAAKWGISGVPDPTPPVGAWLDKSGNARHATQSTAAKRPLVGTQNNRKALTFDGSDDNVSLTPSSPIGSSAFTAIAAIKHNLTSQPLYLAPPLSLTAGNQGRPLERWQGGSSQSIVTIGAVTSNVGGSYRSFSDRFVYGLDALKDGISSGTHQVREYINGAINFDTSNNGSWTTSSQRVNVGSRDDNGTQYKGDICELCVYDRRLSASERQRLERYLAAKWGITLAPQVSNADAQDWINRVYANGGTVSASTAAAVNTFCDAIDSAGIRDRFYRLSLMCGGTSGTTAGLNAALVPLYRTWQVYRGRNLLSSGDTMTATAWTKSGTTASLSSSERPFSYGPYANVITASAGTSVTPYVVNTANNYGYGTVTYSAYLKANGQNSVRMLLSGSSGQTYPGGGSVAYATIDLSTGAVSNVLAGTTATATSVGNGWWRLVYTATNNSAGNASLRFDIGNSIPYNATGSESVLIWGVQSEVGSVATDFDPYPIGNTTDTNVGPFVSGDYAETGVGGGLTGNGTSKYLNTGFPTNTLADGNRHLAAYAATWPNAAYNAMLGSESTAGISNQFTLGHSSIADKNSFGCFSNTSRIQSSVISGGAFWIGINDAAGSGKLYRNGSQDGSAVLSASTPTASNVFVFAINRASSSSATDFFNGRLSGYSIGLSMTAPQAAAYHTAMQAFQTALTRNV